MSICYPMVIPAAAAGADTTTGLKSYWPADEGTGTTVSDDISAHNCTLDSSAMWTGTLLDLVGASNEFGTVTDHADFTPGSAMVLFCWVKAPAGTGAGEGVISHYDFGTNQRSWVILQNTAGSFNKMQVVVSTDGTSSGSTTKNYTGSQTCFDNTFHSIAFRWNSGTLDLFVDGVKDPSPDKSASDGAFSTLHNSTASLCFGDFLNSGIPLAGAFYTGILADIRFYNTAKTDADILAIHNLGHHS